MKKLTKLFVGVACALLLVSSAMAADTVAKTSAPVAIETVSATNTTLFNAGEVGLSLGSGYVVNPAAAFQDKYAFNLNAGAFYFPLKNVGFEANVPFYENRGVSVREVQAGVLFRVPAENIPVLDLIPIIKNSAPYVGVGGVYNWTSQQEWAYVAKVGSEYRFNKKVGLSLEGQYRNDNLRDFDHGSLSLVAALKFVLN